VFPAHHNLNNNLEVSVAGCLGYDVLDHITMNVAMLNKFQLLVV
jgi:hypothetical protein